MSEELHRGNLSINENMETDENTANGNSVCDKWTDDEVDIIIKNRDYFSKMKEYYEKMAVFYDLALYTGPLDGNEHPIP